VLISVAGVVAGAVTGGLMVYLQRHAYAKGVQDTGQAMMEGIQKLSALNDARPEYTPDHYRWFMDRYPNLDMGPFIYAVGTQYAERKVAGEDPNVYDIADEIAQSRGVVPLDVPRPPVTE
jgi:hypothetical protein